MHIIDDLNGRYMAASHKRVISYRGENFDTFAETVLYPREIIQSLPVNKYQYYSDVNG